LATNQPARAFLCRLGFKQEGIHPDALPDGDAVTYGLLRKDAARWLEDKERGQTITTGDS
jgi:RimJ/RimL family protein N-acetyltransferase